MLSEESERNQVSSPHWPHVTVIRTSRLFRLRKRGNLSLLPQTHDPAAFMHDCSPHVSQPSSPKPHLAKPPGFGGSSDHGPNGLQSHPETFSCCPRGGGGTPSPHCCSPPTVARAPAVGCRIPALTWVIAGRTPGLAGTPSPRTHVSCHYCFLR